MRLRVAGAAINFEQHAGAEFGAVELAEAIWMRTSSSTRRKVGIGRDGACLAAVSSARPAAAAESSKNCATSMGEYLRSLPVQELGGMLFNGGEHLRIERLTVPKRLGVGVSP